jgi:hypothetical protein
MPRLWRSIKSVSLDCNDVDMDDEDRDPFDPPCSSWQLSLVSQRRHSSTPSLHFTSLPFEFAMSLLQECKFIPVGGAHQQTSERAAPPVSVEEKGKTTGDKKENCYYLCLWG